MQPFVKRIRDFLAVTKKPTMELRVVQSAISPEHIFVMTHNTDTSSFWLALEEAGFRAGDILTVTLKERPDALR